MTDLYEFIKHTTKKNGTYGTKAVFWLKKIKDKINQNLLGNICLSVLDIHNFVFAPLWDFL